MTPLQKRRIQLMLDRGHTGAVRRALLSMPNDAEARAMLDDMAVSYPYSRLDRAESHARAGFFYLFMGIAVFLLIVLSIGCFQFIQARLSLGDL